MVHTRSYVVLVIVNHHVGSLQTGGVIRIGTGSKIDQTVCLKLRNFGFGSRDMSILIANLTFCILDCKIKW